MPKPAAKPAASKKPNTSGLDYLNKKYKPDTPSPSPQPAQTKNATAKTPKASNKPDMSGIDYLNKKYAPKNNIGEPDPPTAPSKKSYNPKGKKSDIFSRTTKQAAYETPFEKQKRKFGKAVLKAAQDTGSTLNKKEKQKFKVGQAVLKAAQDTGSALNKKEKQKFKVEQAVLKAAQDTGSSLKKAALDKEKAIADAQRKRRRAEMDKRKYGLDTPGITTNQQPKAQPKTQPTAQPKAKANASTKTNTGMTQQEINDIKSRIAIPPKKKNLITSLLSGKRKG